MNYSISDIKNIDKGIFNNLTTWFGSCNAGTKNKEGESFSQVWANHTGGSSVAVVNGKTSYEFINVVPNMNIFEKIEKKFRAAQRWAIN